MAETCGFPDCRCPMDPGPEPEWCARRLPKPEAKKLGTGFRKQAEEVAASVRQGVLQRAAQILRRSGHMRLADEVARVAAGEDAAHGTPPRGRACRSEDAPGASSSGSGEAE